MNRRAEIVRRLATAIKEVRRTPRDEAQQLFDRCEQRLGELHEQVESWDGLMSAGEVAFKEVYGLILDWNDTGKEIRTQREKVFGPPTTTEFHGIFSSHFPEIDHRFDDEEWKEFHQMLEGVDAWSELPEFRFAAAEALEKIRTGFFPERQPLVLLALVFGPEVSEAVESLRPRSDRFLESAKRMLRIGGRVRSLEDSDWVLRNMGAYNSYQRRVQLNQDDPASHSET